MSGARVLSVFYHFCKNKRSRQKNSRNLCTYLILWTSETVTVNRYYHQLINLNNALKEKRPFFGQENHVLLHNNVKLHVAKTTKQIISSGWKLLPFGVFAKHGSFQLSSILSDPILFISLIQTSKQKNKSEKVPMNEWTENILMIELFLFVFK